MSQLQFSVLLAFGVVGVTVLGFLSTSSSSGPAPVPLSSEDAGVDALREEMVALRAEVRALSDGVREIQATQSSLVDRVTPVSIPIAAGEDGAAGAGVSQAAFKEYVAAVLETERELRDQEREEQREEARARMEERRQELEALQQGPYDRYNLRVNSLGKVLGLNDAQKQRYHQVAEAYRAKLEEDMKALREKRQAERETAGETEQEGDGRRRRGGFAGFGGDRDAYRELATTLQEQFEGDVQSLLSADQAALWGELSRDARSFSGRDEIRAPGESGGTRTFGGFGGRTGGPGGFGGRGGGGGRGR